MYDDFLLRHGDCHSPLPRFAEVFPLSPASGRLTVTGQSAQADFVSPAPDFNLGNQGYRSVAYQNGMNKSKSIREGSACAAKKRDVAHHAHEFPFTTEGNSRVHVEYECYLRRGAPHAGPVHRARPPDHLR
jgi:hypothetical protein